jgi:predicted GNAT family N-acyltransferase
MSDQYNVSIREIAIEDYYKGFMDIINIFTRNPLEVSYNGFEEYLKKTLDQNAIILVAEVDNIIIGTLKILKEYKLHNNFTMMAHIEDVVVHEDYRHMKIASSLIEKALEYTKDCYKTTLSCKTELKTLYEKAGFCQAGIALTLYNSISSSVIPSI